MIAVILAAGYGTRLYPLAKETPKALLPVRGKPILQYLLEKIQPPALGIRKILLVSNHRYAQKFQVWLQAANLGTPWEVLDDGSTSEENRLGSVGDFAFAIRARGGGSGSASSSRSQARSVKEEDLLLLGSDNLFPDPLAGFCSFARGKSPAVTLGCYTLPDLAQASRYGVLTLDGESRVRAFTEKPAHPTGALVSTAVYFFPRTAVGGVLEYVGSQSAADTLGTFIHWLIARERVFAYPFRGPWFDIGDLVSYTNAQESYQP